MQQLESFSYPIIDTGAIVHARYRGRHDSTSTLAAQPASRSVERPLSYSKGPSKSINALIVLQRNFGSSEDV